MSSTPAEAHPASYPMGTGGTSLGVKRPGREAEHSPPPTAEVKKTTTPHTSPWRSGDYLSIGTTLLFTSYTFTMHSSVHPQEYFSYCKSSVRISCFPRHIYISELIYNLLLLIYL
jgi:hypothetical protein